jgi:formate dehydrogenase subunit delta
VRIETLTRMADQIGANCSALPEDQAIARIADHLHAFWTPAMIAELWEYDRDHSGELDPRVSTALGRLAS